MATGIMEFLALLALLQAEGQKPKPGPPGPPGPPAVPGAAAAKNGKGAAAAAPATPATAAAAQAAAAKPGGAVPMPPWPTAAVPADLPAFPGPGWVPDTPETQPVSKRADYWNNFLWDQKNKKIVKAFVQEQFGGQWLTFAAQWHPGDKGAQTFMATEAWRLATAPSASPPTVTLTPVQHAAQAMNAALAGHGYKLTDQGLYKAFQSAAGLTADGFPGEGTMAVLKSSLGTMGTSLAPVKVYPWKSGGAYDGVNAPTLAEWQGGAPAAHAAAAHAAATHAAVAPAAAAQAAAAPSPGGMPAAVAPYPGPGAWQTNSAYIARYQAALTWLAAITQTPALDPKGTDGKYGPNTAAAVKAFQAASGLTADGEAGAQTAAAIDQAVMSHAPTSATAAPAVSGQVTFDPREEEEVQAWIHEATRFLAERGFHIYPPAPPPPG